MSGLGRRGFLKATGAAGVALSLAPGRAFGKDPTRPPNLVYVFTDQHRVQAMGFMGEDPVITPNLDAFAAGSKVLFNAVSNRPLCSPYRGMLLTGRWPHSTGLTTNCNSSTPETHLKTSERCISDVLADAGYSCGYIGKWHLDTPQGVPRASHWRKAVWDCYTPVGPQRHGFSFWHAYGCSDDHTHPHYWIGGAPEKEKTFFRRYSPIHEAGVGAGFIENKDGKQRNAEAPFALFVSMNPPHPPFNKVPGKYREIYRDKPLKDLLYRPNVPRSHAQSQRNVRDYYAAVTGVDEAFGIILESIERSGQKDNTIVVFSADHGEMMGSHGGMGKVQHWDESFRIPFIIRQPGVITPGKDPLHLSVPDTMPTLLNLMGMRDEIPKEVEGSDCADVLRGRSGSRPRSAFYTNCAGKRGLRTGRCTFVLTRMRGGEKVQLFDNEKDRYQQRNIAGERKSLVAELKKELDGWLERTGDPWTEA